MFMCVVYGQHDLLMSYYNKYNSELCNSGETIINLNVISRFGTVRVLHSGNI